MWMFYAISLPITLGMVVWMLMYYASPRVLPHVRIIVAYAWFVNVSIVILVPVDIWTAILSQSKSAISMGFSPHNARMTIGVLWSFAYWSAFFLTWLIIPIMQGYEDAGDFTARDRLRTSIRGNLMLIGIVGAIAVVGITILLATGEMAWDNIVSLAIGSSNAFALVTGALLLGSGLVEIPRGLWQNADLSHRYRWLLRRVARATQRLDVAHRELSTAIVIAQATSLQMQRHDRLRPMMDVIDAMACEDSTFKPSGGQMGEDDMDYDADEHSMAALRRRLRNAQDNFSRCKTEYCSLVLQALQLEDTIHNSKQEGSRRFESSLRPPRHGAFALLLDVAEWWWRCVVCNHVVRCVSLLLALLSVMIIFAEATLLSHKWVDLSLISALIHMAGLHENIVLLMVFVPLVYLCACTYYTLFKLGIFSFYYLVPGHTDSVSLLMNCSMVSRYAAPMCYNFLSLVHLRYTTVFEENMKMPASFDGIYPLCMVLWSALIAANVHNRLMDALDSLLAMFRLHSWRSLRFDDDNPDVNVEEGRITVSGLAVLRKERGSLQRGVPLCEEVVPLARHFSTKDLTAATSPGLHGGRTNGYSSPMVRPISSLEDVRSPNRKNRKDIGTDLEAADSGSERLNQQPHLSDEPSDAPTFRPASLTRQMMASLYDALRGTDSGDGSSTSAGGGGGNGSGASASPIMTRGVSYDGLPGRHRPMLEESALIGRSPSPSKLGLSSLRPRVSPFRGALDDDDDDEDDDDYDGDGGGGGEGEEQGRGRDRGPRQSLRGEISPLGTPVLGPSLVGSSSRLVTRQLDSSRSPGVGGVAGMVTPQSAGTQLSPWGGGAGGYSGHTSAVSSKSPLMLGADERESMGVQAASEPRVGRGGGGGGGGGAMANDSPASLLLSGWANVRARMQELSSSLGLAGEQQMGGGRGGGLDNVSKSLSGSSSADLLSPGDKEERKVESVFEGLRSKRAVKLRGDFDFD